MRLFLPITIFISSTATLPLNLSNLFSLIERQPVNWELVRPDGAAIEQSVEDWGIEPIHLQPHYSSLAEASG